MGAKRKPTRPPGAAVSGILVGPCVVETEGEMICFPAGSRVVVALDESMPSMVRPVDRKEMAAMIENVGCDVDEDEDDVQSDTEVQ